MQSKSVDYIDRNICSWTDIWYMLRISKINLFPPAGKGTLLFIWLPLLQSSAPAQTPTLVGGWVGYILSWSSHPPTQPPTHPTHTSLILHW